MLIPEWKAVLLKGWSSRVLVLGIVVDIALELVGSDLPPLVGVGLSMLALYLRIAAQRGPGFTLPEREQSKRSQEGNN